MSLNVYPTSTISYYQSQSRLTHHYAFASPLLPRWVASLRNDPAKSLQYLEIVPNVTNIDYLQSCYYSRELVILYGGLTFSGKS